MHTISAILILALLSPEALAKKCGARFYAISGAVTDSNGQPLAGAMVGASWLDDNAPQGPAITTTDSRGRYSIPVRFHPVQCSSGIERFSVSAYTATHRSSAAVLPAGSAHELPVPPLRVVLPIEFEPVWPDEIRG